MGFLYFACQATANLNKKQKFISIKTDDGEINGKISLYCTAPKVSRQAFYDYLANKDKPWKYQTLSDAMIQIHNEDEENVDYGRVRMY